MLARRRGLGLYYFSFLFMAPRRSLASRSDGLYINYTTIYLSNDPFIK